MASKKAVLMTSWGRGTGGADTVVRVTAEELQRRGVDVDILNHHYRGPFVLDTSSGSRTFRSTDEVVSSIDWSKYAVLHNGTSSMTDIELTGIQRRSPCMPQVYTAHGVTLHETIHGDADYQRYFGTLPEAEKRLVIEKMKRDPRIGMQNTSFAHADRVLHMSMSAVNMFAYYYPEYADIASSLPHGSDMYRHDNRQTVARAAEIRRELGGGKVILYSGRLTTQKGVSDLADAFRIVNERTPDAKLLVMGGYGSAEKLVLDRLTPKQRKNVTIHPWVDSESERAAHYKASDVLVLPSHYETFGMAVLEAMMLGTPVVVSNIDGPAELWVQPGFAYGSVPRDVLSIADNIEYVLHFNPPQVVGNAKAAQRYAKRRYSIANVANALLALYDYESQKKGGAEMVDSRDREDFYSTLADLTGEEHFRETGKKYTRGIIASLPSEDKFAQEVYPSSTRDAKKSNGLSQATIFYSTPGFRHRGIIVKKVTPKELEILEKASRRMTGTNRIPEIIEVDRKELLVAQQRIYGPEMLSLLLRSPQEASVLVKDAAYWLKDFHGPADLSTYEIGQTLAYRKFMERLQAYRERFGKSDDFRNIHRLVEEKWKPKKFRSPMGVVHGDMSPIHLFYEDGNVYGIDFNASHNGATNEDPGMFIGNTEYHLRHNGLPQDRVNSYVQSFLDAYGTPLETGFYLARSYFSKATMASRPDGLLAASRRLLEKPFDISLIDVTG